MKSSFPLAALALLMSAFACLFACADIERWRQQYTWLSADWPWRLVALFGGAAIFGGIIGLGFMVKSKGRLRTRALAIVAGMIAGQIGALLLVAPGPVWRTVFAMLVLLASAILFRINAD